MDRKQRMAVTVVAVVGMLLAGCAAPVLIPAPPPLDRQEIISIVNQRASQLRTLKANLSIKVKTAQMKGPETLSAYFAAAAPDKLRLRANHALVGYSVLDIGSDGAQWWVAVHFQETNRVDYGSLANLAAQPGGELPIRPDQVVAALGMATLTEAPDRYWMFTKPPGEYVLQEVVNSRPTRYVATQIVLDGKTQLMRRFETVGPTGRVETRATMEDYVAVAGIPIAQKVVIYWWDKDQLNTMEFKFQDIQVNGELPGKVFEQPSFQDIPVRVRHPIEPSPRAAATQAMPGIAG